MDMRPMLRSKRRVVRDGGGEGDACAAGKMLIRIGAGSAQFGRVWSCDDRLCQTLTGGVFHWTYGQTFGLCTLSDRLFQTRFYP
jgi:hypothetical protein